jgi:hypothetical protein
MRPLLPRRSFLQGSAAALAGVAGAGMIGHGAPTEPAPPLLDDPQRTQALDAALRARRWLFAEQQAGGGWHSTTYGGLRDGAATTALVLATLAQWPAHEAPEITAAVERAGKFLQTGFRKRQTIAAPDGSLDYPTYAAALVLQATRAFADLDRLLPSARLIEYLIRAQAAQGRGITNESPDYGGWDLLGSENATGITTGTNVSVTAYVLDVLAPIESEEAREACRLAHGWVQRAQDATRDGGFAFTPDAPSLSNKARWHDAERTQVRSYGTTTADGLRALLALQGTERRAAEAQQWLIDHPNVNAVPGFDEVPAQQGWSQGLRFYYAHSLSRVLDTLPRPIAQDRAEKLAHWLLREQAADGSWRNESARMREDDPLIATSFAAWALNVLSGLR